MSRRCGEQALARILIVEDEEQVRVLAESYLREQGHQTLSAATMEQALALLDVAAGIDLLFVDVGLYEDRNVGLDLAQQAVLRKPDLKVLYTTGQTVTDGLKHCWSKDRRFSRNRTPWINFKPF
jgi:DNA-binding NtrC family response regulator